MFHLVKTMSCGTLDALIIDGNGDCQNGKVPTHLNQERDSNGIAENN
jgi:hypothetical protein